MPPPADEVAGLAKDGGKAVKIKDGKEKNILPISTAEYNPFDAPGSMAARSRSECKTCSIPIRLLQSVHLRTATTNRWPTLKTASVTFS
jgi:hypothetical protein